jgi:hypothetical protein
MILSWNHWQQHADPTALIRQLYCCPPKTSRICIKTNGFKPFRIRTRRPTCIIHKTNNFKPRRINTYAIHKINSFRIDTYKKERGRGHPHAERRPHPGTVIRGCVPESTQGSHVQRHNICHPCPLARLYLTLWPRPTSPQSTQDCGFNASLLQSPVTSHKSPLTAFPRTVSRPHTSNGCCLADQCV